MTTSDLDPDALASLWDKERAPWELEPHFSEAMLLLTSKDVFAKSAVATVIANHRASIERLTDERDATRNLLQVTFRLLTERNEEIASLTAREPGVTGKGEK